MACIYHLCPNINNAPSWVWAIPWPATGMCVLCSKYEFILITFFIVLCEYEDNISILMHNI